jgi:hypothetical protein
VARFSLSAEIRFALEKNAAIPHITNGVWFVDRFVCSSFCK